MKKIFIFTIMTLLTLTILGPTKVSAKQCSGYQFAPPITPVLSDYKGPTYELQTAASSCIGNNTEVWFRNLTTIDAKYQYNYGEIHMYLYEDDPPASEPDEKVKYYQASVINRVITRIDMHTQYMTIQNIDSAGDQTCELYIRFSSSGESGGPWITLPERIYKSDCVVVEYKEDQYVKIEL